MGFFLSITDSPPVTKGVEYENEGEVEGRNVTD